LKGASGADRDARIIAAGSVQENRGRPEAGLDRALNVLKVLPHLSVGLDEAGLTAGRLDFMSPSLAALLVAAEQDDARARLSKTFSHSASKDTRSANDNGDFTGQIK
jgi:hypothetical protein